MKVRKKNLLIAFFITFGIIIFCGYKNNLSEEFNTIDFWLLPVAYFFIEMIFISDWKKIKNSYGIITIEIVAFIRYIAIALSYYVNYDLKFNIQNKKIVVFLMIVELFLSKCIIHFNLKENKNKIEITNNSSHNLLIILLALLFFPIVILNPSLVNRISWINTEKKIEIDTIIILIYGFSSIILSLLIIHKIKNNNFIKSKIIKIILSTIIMIFFAINISINSDGNISRWTLLAFLITETIILSHLYVDNKKMIRNISLLCISILIIFSTFFKFSDSIVEENTKDSFDLKNVIVDNTGFKSLDAYFSGPYQVSKAIELKNLFGDRISIKTFINDIFANCPKINKMLDVKNMTPYYYNYAYYGHDKYTDKICPMIGQGYIFFDLALAPVLSMIVTYACVLISNKIEGKKDILELYILTFSSIYLGLFMCVNMNIVFQGIWIKLLPIYVIYWGSNRIKVKI